MSVILKAYKCALDLDIKEVVNFILSKSGEEIFYCEKYIIDIVRISPVYDKDWKLIHWDIRTTFTEFFHDKKCKNLILDFSTRECTHFCGFSKSDGKYFISVMEFDRTCWHNSKLASTIQYNINRHYDIFEYIKESFNE